VAAQRGCIAPWSDYSPRRIWEPLPQRGVRRITNPFKELELLNMLGWALTFLVIAVIAGVFGFGGIAATSAGIAQVIFVVFLILFALSLLAGLFRRS
jgi:uncharacterized membrane protein YtjA (UPF0391 family)